MSKRPNYYLVYLVCVILIYELPYFLTLSRTGWTEIPPVFSADVMLYLNLSDLHTGSHGMVVNPWYGNIVPALDVPYLRFPITSLLFRLTHGMLGSWTASMLVWTAIWAALTFVSAAFCLESLFPEHDHWLTTSVAFGLLVLQSPLTYVAEIRQMPSLRGFFELALPYSRFAYPQVVMPLVFTYLGFQARALGTGSRRILVLMALLQFAAFATFPYVLPVLAIGTAIALLIILRGKSETILPFKTLMIFGAACGVMDAAYVFLMGLEKSHGNVQFAIQFRPEMILPSLRTYVVLLLAVSVLALLSRTSLVAKAVVVGLAVSNALLAFSDVFFPPTTLLLDHINYILVLTTWLPLMVVLSPWLKKFDRRPLRIALPTIIAMIALWEGFSGYRSNLPTNMTQKSAIAELGKLTLTDKDLVIGSAQFPDDISSWVPLIAHARVLYTPNGENILSAESIRTDQSFREAVYLEMSGKDHAALISMTGIGSSDSQLNAIVRHGDAGYQRSPLAADRVYVRALIRDRLGPLLARLESDPASARYLFQGYDRIVVIDSISEPVFKASALSPWLQIQQAYERNGIRIWICRPKKLA